MIILKVISLQQEWKQYVPKTKQKIAQFKDNKPSAPSIKLKVFMIQTQANKNKRKKKRFIYIWLSLIKSKILKIYETNKIKKN